MGSLLLEHSTLPIPTQSMSVKHGYSKEGQDTSSTKVFENNSIFSGLMVTGASEENDVTISYSLPNTIITDNKYCSKYSLFIQKQPGVKVRYLKLTVILPDSSHIVSQSHKFTSLDDSKLSLELDLRTDTYIELTYHDRLNHEDLINDEC